jgi:hypothetical protein
MSVSTISCPYAPMFCTGAAPRCRGCRTSRRSPTDLRPRRTRRGHPSRARPRRARGRKPAGQGGARSLRAHEHDGAVELLVAGEEVGAAPTTSQSSPVDHVSAAPSTRSSRVRASILARTPPTRSVVSLGEDERSDLGHQPSRRTRTCALPSTVVSAAVTVRSMRLGIRRGRRPWRPRGGRRLPRHPRRRGA